MKKEDLANLFDKIDADHSGFIDVNELDHALKATGEKFRSFEIKSMMDAADENHDGKISKEEFLHMWEKALQQDGTHGQPFVKPTGPSLSDEQRRTNEEYSVQKWEDKVANDHKRK